MRMSVSPITPPLPPYPQNPGHPQFPGIDVDKGPVYSAAAIVIGGWVVVVVAAVALALFSWSTWPLVVLRWELPRLLVPLLLAAAVMFRFIRDRKRFGLRPRRFGISRLEASREAVGPSTRKVIWSPYDRLPPLFRNWLALWLFDVGDGLVDLVLKVVGTVKPPMVEEPPYYDAPLWIDDRLPGAPRTDGDGGQVHGPGGGTPTGPTPF